MPQWSEQINHLTYADDTIIFVSSEKKSVGLVMDVLNKYEEQSGQLVNKQKSEFLVYRRTANTIVEELKANTGFAKGNFALIYLGCPISNGNKKKVQFVGLMKNIHNKLQIWKGKMLSFGGKSVLINSVLIAFPFTCFLL